MLIILFLIVFAAISFVIVHLDIKFWRTDILQIIGILLGVLSSIGVFLAIIALIFSLCNAPFAQARYEDQYAILTQKVAHIDSYNQYEIEEMVRKWNLDYRTNVEARKSPWVGSFYTLNTEKVDLIEMGGLYE